MKSVGWKVELWRYVTTFAFSLSPQNRNFSVCFYSFGINSRGGLLNVFLRAYFDLGGEPHSEFTDFIYFIKFINSLRCEDTRPQTSPISWISWNSCILRGGRTPGLRLNRFHGFHEIHLFLGWGGQSRACTSPISCISWNSSILRVGRTEPSMHT